MFSPVYFTIIFSYFFYLCIAQNDFAEIRFPPARSFLCKLKINKNCGNANYTIDPIISSADYLFNSINEKQLASASNSNFKELNKYGMDRWVYLTYNKLIKNSNEYILPMRWFVSTTNTINKFIVYFPFAESNEEKPLEKSLFDLSNPCVYIPKKQSNLYSVYNFECPVSTHLINKKINLYTICELNTNISFYQVIDVILLKPENW